MKMGVRITSEGPKRVLLRYLERLTNSVSLFLNEDHLSFNGVQLSLFSLSKMKLDIGAGTHKLDGYQSFGYDLEGQQDIRWNLWDLPLPFKDNEIETIHASAIMEHFPEPHCIELMSEFHRVLQPKGTVHIYVPNLTNSAILLIAARLLSLKTLPSRGNIYGTQINYQDPETRHLSYFFRLHKYGYTAPILRAMLKGAGFVDVRVTGDSHWKRITGKHEYERSSTLGWLVSKLSPTGLYGTGSKQSSTSSSTSGTI